jgi:hypothetical protein
LIVTIPKPEEIQEIGTQFAPFWETWAKARGPEVAEVLVKVRAVLGR